jgi:CO/xanthine dehydrogenase Mo-binding subunit
MLDVPANMASAAADIPDPFNPMGGRGIGEPSQGCAVAAMTSAIADALEGHLFNRIPVTADMIVNHVADNSYGPRSLKLNTF